MGAKVLWQHQSEAVSAPREISQRGSLIVLLLSLKYTLPHYFVTPLGKDRVFFCLDPGATG